MTFRLWRCLRYLFSLFSLCKHFYFISSLCIILSHFWNISFTHSLNIFLLCSQLPKISSLSPFSFMSSLHIILSHFWYISFTLLKCFFHTFKIFLCSQLPKISSLPPLSILFHVPASERPLTAWTDRIISLNGKTQPEIWNVRISNIWISWIGF